MFSQTNDAVANALRDLIVVAAAESGSAHRCLLRRRIFGESVARQIRTGNRHRLGQVCHCGRERKCDGKGNLHRGRRRSESQGRGGSPNRRGSTRTGRLRSSAPTTFIVDPPATGLEKRATHNYRFGADTLIYVSCNPATLARDLRDLRTNLTIDSVTPLDMFPQTAEIEVVVHLRAVPHASRS